MSSRSSTPCPSSAHSPPCSFGLCPSWQKSFPLQGPPRLDTFVSCVPSVPVCGNLGLLRDSSTPTGHTGWTVLAHLCSCKAPTQVWLAGRSGEGSASVYTVKLTPGRGQGSVTHSPSLKELLAGPVLKGCGCPISRPEVTSKGS